MLEERMSNGGAQSASGIATYRTARELGARSPRSYAAVREPNEQVVIHRFARSTDPRAKSTASFVAADGSVSLGSEAMTNLVRDARCLAKNWHPNIAKVRHVDVVGDEITVATELVDGATLGDLLQAAAAERARGAANASEPLLPLPVLVRILVDVVTGLSGLHGLRDEKGAPLGTIHGALSPANIVVGKDGVARLLNALRPRPLRMAAGTEAVGYAAPEALDLGATQDVRADLHSVGVIMWEALNGRRLYDETEPTRVLARQREEDVPPPAFPAGSPFARLADVTMQAMAFEASLRFKTAAELGAALRNIAATRIATGSVVAARVAELAGERIRSRRVELDPGATGKRRLAADSDRALRAAKAAAASPARPAAPPTEAGPERDTLPPGSMDAGDFSPASAGAVDLSVRDFLATGETPSAPALATAPPAPAPPPTHIAKQPPPLLRKTAAAAPPVATKASPVAQATLKGAPAPAPPSAPSLPAAKPAPSAPSLPAAKPAPSAPSLPAAQSTLKGMPEPTMLAEEGPPVVPIVPVVAQQAPIQVAQAPVVEEHPPLEAPVLVAEAPYVSPPVFDAPPVHGAPPPVAYAPVTHSTPDAFTPSGDAPPRDRRSLVGILLGCAMALLLLVGFFAVRAMVAGPETKTTAAEIPSGSDPRGTTTALASAEATGAKPNDEAKTGTPSTAVTAPATALATATAADTAAAPGPDTTAAPVTEPVVPAAPAEAPAPAPPAPAAPATAEAGGMQRAPAQGAPATGVPGPAVKPPSAGPPKPKRPTYEPLGI
jgi:serine/threonine protein kinase